MESSSAPGRRAASVSSMIFLERRPPPAWINVTSTPLRNHIDMPAWRRECERLHRTTRKWLGARSRAQTLADLQAQGGRVPFVRRRDSPHRAIGRRPPALAYAARPKAVPMTGRPTPPGSGSVVT